MHRCNRVPCVRIIPGAELGCQLGKPGRQHCRVLRRELPGHPNLSQVTARIFERHTGFPRPTQATQGHCPRPRTIAARQPGVQLGEQVLSAGQELWRVGQPHRLPGDPTALVIHHLTDSGSATVRDHGARADSGPPRSATTDPDPALIPGPAPLSAGPGPLVLRKAAHVSHNPDSGMVTDTKIVTAVASR